MAWRVDDSLRMDDPSLLAPEFAPVFLELVNTAWGVGLPVKVWETLRDHRRQAAYYARGRTVEPDRPVITQAEPGESAHEWGFAGDIVLDIPGVNPWAGLDPRKPRARAKYEPVWRQLADIGRELGLVTGYHHWGWDWPHFQMSKWYLHKPDGWRERVRHRLERAPGD